MDKNLKPDKTIGILAVQGDFSCHGKVVHQLGLRVRWVKTPGDLSGCAALILPGGESTTMTLLLKKYGLMKPLKEFGCRYPVMGTCAGAIMLSRNTHDPKVEPLGIMDIAVERNAYGSQVESFVTDLNVSLDHGISVMKAVFIRAPKIHVESPAIQILAEYEDAPVIVRQNNALALSFHPELTGDDRIHRYFLQHMAGISLKNEMQNRQPAERVHCYH